MKLLNCPFCDARPYKETQIKKNKFTTSCANNKCEIFGIPINVIKWNDRETVNKITL